MAEIDGQETVWAGCHLSMIKRGNWEYATRNTAKSAVGIVAVTDDRRVVLVEQYRPPVHATVVELPAGLAGDVAGAEDESLVEAARRELFEETGYEARRWTELGGGFSTPGLTDESILLFLAEELEKVGPGGGDENESITIHEVPLDGVNAWLTASELQADLKVFAGLHFADDYMARRVDWKQGTRR